MSVPNGPSRLNPHLAGLDVDLASTFAELTDSLGAGGSVLLLTDYDGSLTPIVGHPGDASLARDVRADLRSLARSPRVRVGVISGRAVDDVRERVGLPGIIYAGCHGLEVTSRRLRFRHPAAVAQQRVLDALLPMLAHRTRAIEGILIEPKGLSVGVHYRKVAAEQVPLVEQEVVQVVTDVSTRFPAARLGVFRGNQVLEIVPRVGWGKGECALWIWRRIAIELPRPVTMLYLGDDITAELAFRTLAGKAITVCVGRREAGTGARYRLPDVSHAVRLISALVEEVRAA
jgi:trehalose-phosphatase